MNTSSSNCWSGWLSSSRSCWDKDICSRASRKSLFDRVHLRCRLSHSACNFFKELPNLLSKMDSRLKIVIHCIINHTIKIIKDLFDVNKSILYISTFVIREHGSSIHIEIHVLPLRATNGWWAGISLIWRFSVDKFYRWFWLDRRNRRNTHYFTGVSLVSFAHL